MMRHRQLFVAAALSAAIVVVAPLRAQKPAVNPIGAAVQEFQKRVAAYVEIHKKAQGQVPSLSETSDPAKIAAREAALGEAIRQLRAGAKPGDVFCVECGEVIKTAIRKDFAGRPAADRKALVQELPQGITVTVNMTYPTTAALGTFPAKLLRELPDLPPEVEYRFLSRHLILRDVKANVVVDVLRNVVPPVGS